jgi:hypothetical protein
VSFTNENFLGFIDELEDKVEAVKQLGQDIDYETEPYSVTGDIWYVKSSI